MPNHSIFTLKMANAMFAKMHNFQHSMQLTTESQSCTLNSSQKKPKDKDGHLIQKNQLWHNQASTLVIIPIYMTPVVLIR
jgi:hypothetical protein